MKGLKKLIQLKIVQDAEALVASAKTPEEFVLRTEASQRFLKTLNRTAVRFHMLNNVIDAAASLHAPFTFKKLAEAYAVDPQMKRYFLSAAAESSFVEGVKILQETVGLEGLQVSDYDKVLETAIWKGGLEMVQWIMEASGWPVSPLSAQKVGLKRALAERQVDTVRYLIKNGADITSKDMGILDLMKSTGKIFVREIADAIYSGKAPYSEKDLPRELKGPVIKELEG